MTPIRLTQSTALVLAALAAGHRHGFSIMEATGLPSGTVYPVLRRLEGEGAVSSMWEGEEAAKAAGRPRRRTYDLTPHGHGAAGAVAERLAPTGLFLERRTSAPGEV